LPPPATPMAQTVLGTPIPIQVVVTAVTLYRTPLDGLWILGELRNDGDLPVENIQVEISLTGEGGDLVVLATAWALPAIVPSGETAPFGVLLPQAPANLEAPGAAAPAAAVIGGQTVTDLGSRYLDLAAETTAITIEESRVLLTGYVENSGQETATQIALVATFYDGQGRVTGYQVHYFDDSLMPGGRLPFDLAAAPPGGQTAAVRLAAQGHLVRE